MVSSPGSDFGSAMPSDPSERSAAEAVHALRSALRHSDVDAMQNARWLAPRPPGERDLLSDLAAAEGLEPAVRRLSRFWRRAEVRLERVRMISPLEAEVYERLALPGESLPILSLVRRTAADSGWRVVCTIEAYDEKFTLWLTSERDTIDDVAWSRTFMEKFGRGADLIMDEGNAGVLGDPEYGWLAHVRGPFVPRAWPDQLPGEGSSIVELTAALTPEWDARRAQLTWLLQAGATFLDHLGGPAAYLPSHEKLVLPQALEVAVRGELRPEQALRFWARVEEADHHFVTSGLRQLALPEVEAPTNLLSEPGVAARLVRWLGGQLIEGTTMPAIGTELVFGDQTLAIVAGRRGPRRGKSYGRWGALRIAASDPQQKGRKSRMRLRVPDDFR